MFFHKRSISILTAVALVTTSVLSPVVSTSAANINERVTGNYGDNISYTYFRDNLSGSDTTLSTLILEGTGKMMDLTSDAADNPDEQYNNQPWIAEALNNVPTYPDEISRMHIDEVLVGENIAELGTYTFCNYPGTIRLNKNITDIPAGCFEYSYGCTLYFYGELTSVANSAFSNLQGTTFYTIHVVSEESKAKIVETNSSLESKIKVDLTTDIIPLRIAVKKGLMEERLNEVSDRDRYTSSSWDAYYQTVEAGAEKLKDDAITDEDVTTCTAAINEAAEQLVSFEALNTALEAADKISAWHYTEESRAALETAVAAGKQVADDVTKEQIAKLAQDIEDALENLEDVSKEYANAALSTTVTEANALVESDYKPEGWTALQEAVDAAGSIVTDAPATDIMDARQDIIKAMNALEIQYPDPEPLANIYFEQTTMITSGTADDSMAGAVKMVIEFDCAKGVSYNPYSTIDISSTIAGKNIYKQFTGTDGSYKSGSTGWKEAMEFPAMKKGDTYSIQGMTYSWDDVEGVVYLIQSVSFYDAEGTLLKKIISTPTAGLEDAITVAQKKLETLKTGDYSADSVKALEDAITEACELLEQDSILPSEITRLTQALQDTADNLQPADTTASRSELDTALSGAKALKEEDYTANSWRTLQTAVQKAEALSANALNSEILSVVNAINLAINALVPAEGSDIPTSPAPGASTSPAPDNPESPAPDVPATPAPNITASPAPATPTPNPSGNPDEENLTLPKANVKKVQAKKAKLSIQLKNVIKDADNYEIVVANNKKFKNSTSTVTTGKNTAKITVSYKKLKIKKKKTYYLKVRATKKTSQGTVYGKYSNVIKFKAR